MSTSWFSSSVPCSAFFENDATRHVGGKSQHCCHSDVNALRLLERRRHRIVVAAGSGNSRMRDIRTRSTTIACAAGVLALGASSAHAQPTASTTGNIVVETVAKGLDHPWALAFLPDGRMLVTERPGSLRIVSRDGKLSPALAGVPKVFASGQGGLHDVIIDRGYGQNQTIYLCYAEPLGPGARTALARARLVDAGTPRLEDVTVIFQQDGPLSHGNHFGCRIVQTPDGNL